MEGIYSTDSSFDFGKLTLITPTVVAGGNYFIKFKVNMSPFYVQPPKCKTKHGIYQSGKKWYCDLIFTNEDEEFIQWIENLENHCRRIIFNNRAKWFQTELDEHDIETSFTSPLKVFKYGKSYLMRANIPSSMEQCMLSVYNENEEEVGIQRVKEDIEVRTIIELHGIKCSPRNFQIELEIKQMMIIEPKPLFNRCLFKNSSSTYGSTPTTTPTHKDISSVQQPPQIDFRKVTEEFTNNENIVEPSSDTLECNEEPEERLDMDMQELEDVVPPIVTDDLMEIDMSLETLKDAPEVSIKPKNDIYYEMYREAKRKAKIARDLAISSYLEAKKIKNKYMLENLDSDDSEFEESFDNLEDEQVF